MKDEFALLDVERRSYEGLIVAKLGCAVKELMTHWEWQQLEEQLGFPIPVSLRRFWDSIGPGVLGHGIRIYSPLALDPSHRFDSKMLRNYIAGEQAPDFAVLYPNLPGFVSLGSMDGIYIAYEAKRTLRGVECDAPVVLVDRLHKDLERTPYDFAEFIYRTLTGNVPDCGFLHSFMVDDVVNCEDPELFCAFEQRQLAGSRSEAS
jgi:hypothetical protein